jgi:hypothetical protein
MLEFLFLFALTSVIAVVLWYRSFQEFTILQYDFTSSLEVPDERTPIVVRDIPPDYIKFWRSEFAKQSSLPILTASNSRTILKEYASSNTGIYHPLTATELAKRFHVHDKFKDYMTFLKKFWYLPITQMTSPAKLWILNGSDNEILKLQRSLAERTVLTVHEGSAVVWLARETLPIKEILRIKGKDPWQLTIANFPFIGDLQYIEVVVRAGNCLVLPPRSLFAVRNKDSGNTSRTYLSLLELHSPLSMFISSIVTGTT